MTDLFTAPDIGMSEARSTGMVSLELSEAFDKGIESIATHIPSTIITNIR